MPHDISLISTIAVSLVYALAGGYVAVRLGLSPLVGYLLAGVAVGPFTPGFVADTHLAPQLAEIGVMLLMFGVGMHFSVADLLAVRAVALPGAALQMTLSTALGIGVCKLWGWNFEAGLVFGLAVSIASTVVMLRALEEMKLGGTDEGRLAVGWLVVEDLLTVLILVLLPAFAGPLGGQGLHESGAAGANSAPGVLLSICLTLGKVALFVAAMLVAGKRVFSWMLAQVARTNSRELFTLAVIALALGVAYGSAELFGVSFALGAFFAGMVINESDSSHRAAKDLQPLQDAFSVLFFVAIGMLFDPMSFVRHPLQILVTAAIIVAGKSLITFGIAVVFRCSARKALTLSAGLAQIGEFSFVLVALGVQLGLFPAEAQHLVLAGALVSITLNPALFRLVMGRPARPVP